MVGSTAFAWIPTVLDTIAPFVLGIIEFTMIGFAVGPTQYFLLVMAIACLPGAFAWGNCWFHAKRGFYINNVLSTSRPIHKVRVGSATDNHRHDWRAVHFKPDLR